MLQSLHLSPKVVMVLAGLLVFILALMAVSKVPLGYNLRNLLVRWRITLLTALAFTLVVGLLTFMLAFVNGMDRLTENSGQPGNVMVLSDGATDELFSNLAKSDTTNIEQQKDVQRTRIAEREVPLCSKEVYIVVNQPIPPAAVPNATQVRGKITAIASDKGTFTLQDADDKEWQFHYTDDGKLATNFLKAGERVLVVYNARGGENWVSQLHGSTRRRFTQVRGIEDALVASRVHGLDLFAGGQWFSDAGVQELPGKKGSEPVIQAVLGEGVARILGQDAGKERLENGDVFELGSRKWLVTGVMQSSGSTFGSEIWAKASIVGPMFGKDQYTCLVLRSQDAPTAKRLADFLSKDYKPAVRAEPENEYYAKLSETNKQFSIAIYFVTIIMSIGGVFGVMNTMFAAISQRIKDIGVLRILGFARWQILVSFFLETMAIALVGGLMGCALGSICDGWTATSIVSSGQGGGKTVVLKLAVDANTLMIGLLFTIIMGALGGLVPALSAMRLRPLESVR